MRNNSETPLPVRIFGTCAMTIAGAAAISPPAVSIAASIGTFFAPNAAAAAGGAANLIAASAAGSIVTFVPGALGLVFSGLFLITGFNIGSQNLIGLAIAIGAIDLACTFIFAAKIGAGITGVAASSVMLVNAIGASVMLLGLAVVAGLVIAAGAAFLSSFAEAVTPSALRC